MNQRLTAASLLILLALPALAQAEPPSETAKIDQLIRSVREMKDAEFIRNGNAYDGAAAADHIQAKYNRAKDKVKTAREFIEKCASKSEMSGEAYKIRFKDGTEKMASEWLTAKLDEIEKAGQ